MKTRVWAATIVILCAGLAFAATKGLSSRHARPSASSSTELLRPVGEVGPSRTLATCVGANPCKACKNCKYCAHCSKNGGTCGVKK